MPPVAETANQKEEEQWGQVGFTSWADPNPTVEKTIQDSTKPQKPVDHFAADENEYLANHADSDSDQDDSDIIFHDLQLFFHAIGEPDLIDMFVSNKVTLGQLLDFDEQDLINCGVNLVGPRKKILSNIGQMHCEKWQPSSLHDMTEKSMLSSPGIYVALNDINKHLEYIGVTLKYLKRKIQNDPKILELGKDYVGIGKVSEELEDMTKTTKTTIAAVESLKREINKHMSNPLLKPPNHIDENYIRELKPNRSLMFKIWAGIAVGCTLGLAKFLIKL